MATIAQIDANRRNAKLSAGPTTAAGKAIASTNPLQFGLRSPKMFVSGEDPAEFDALRADLIDALKPVGAVENALVERIAIGQWRQWRLVRAENAIIDLERRDARIARELERLNDPSLGSRITVGSLQEFDGNQEAWCRTVVDEIAGLPETTLASIESSAPLLWRQLSSDAEDDSETPEEHVKAYPEGLGGYIAELSKWCREQLRLAEACPRLLALAEQLRQRDMVLPARQLEVLSRYQTTIDNQLYKALRAFREAQEWRLKTLDGSVGDDALTDAETVEAVAMAS